MGSTGLSKSQASKDRSIASASSKTAEHLRKGSGSERQCFAALKKPVFKTLCGTDGKWSEPLDQGVGKS
jgi:hypothetical protein